MFSIVRLLIYVDSNSLILKLSENGQTWLSTTEIFQGTEICKEVQTTTFVEA